MELIYSYIILASIITLMAIVDLYRPVLNQFELSTDRSVLYYVTLAIISFLVAPILIYPCISSTAGKIFRDTLEKNLFQNELE
jgi:hypothetical protein